jgi:hypothetical protein
MDLARARYLVSGRGKAALASLPASLAELPLNSLAATLRRDFASVEAAALGEQVTLRARAAERHGADRGLLFTAEGLEMMTHPAVAQRRAARLAALGLPVIDLTCGIGGDLFACAEAGSSAFGLERDPATALLAAANVPRAAVVRGDALRAPFDLAKAMVFIDPSRRAGGSRRFDPRAFSPPWDAAVSLLEGAAGGVLKAPPGIDHHHFPPGSEVEWVQLGRSLREAAVWMGQGAEPGVRRAVWLPSGTEIDSGCEEAEAAPSVPRAFIFDPESCVTNAGLVRHLAFRLGASLMDTKVAYLTADAPAEDPLAVAFEVLEVVPFSLARLKERLRARGLKADEIRRRAFPVEPDELRRLLGPMDGEPVTLLCTTIAGKRTVFIARRVKPNIA